MPFGAEHVESSSGDDFLGLFGYVGLDRREHVVPGDFVFVGSFDRAEALRVHLRHGEEFGVAAEHHVGATTRHVGGDGDRTESAGLRDDCGLTSVVLGVEHLVTHTLLGEQT